MTNLARQNNSSAVEKHRVQFYFEPEAVKALDEMQVRTGLASRAEVVRYGLRFFEWLLDETEEGSQIVVRRPNGELEGVLLPFRRQDLKK